MIRHYLREAPDPAPLCEALVFYSLAEHRSVVYQPYQTPEGRGRAVTPRRAGLKKSSRFKLNSFQAPGDTMRPPAYLQARVPFNKGGIRNGAQHCVQRADL